MPGIAKRKSTKLKRQWKKIISDCKESKKTVREYCKENGFPESRYFYWSKKLKEAEPTWSEIQSELQSERVERDEVSSLFLPIEISGEKKKNEQEENFLFELKSGHKILVPASTGLDALKNLITALENNKC